MNNDNQLRQSQFWAQTDCLENCESCRKVFSPLVLKFDCLNCHKNFCNKCSYLLIGVSVSLPRVCSSCLILVKSGLTTNLNTSLSSQLHIDPETRYIKPDENILDLIQELQPSVDLNLEVSIEEFANKYTLSVLNEYQQDVSWAEILKKVALEVVETISPSVKIRNDLMNINNYLNFICIPTKHQECVFFQGGVIKPRVFENLPNTLENPKIIYLDNRPDFNDTDFKDLKQSFIEIINKYKPDLIVCTETLPEIVINELFERRVQHILKSDLTELAHVSRITNGIILKSINEANQIKDFLGTCNKVQVNTIGTETFICFLDIMDYTLGGSILIGGESSETIKMVLKKMLIAFRNAKLERIFLFECGSRLKSDTLITQYSEKISFKFVRVCGGDKANRPVIKCVKFYKNNDFSIGNFINSLIYSSNELCSKCGILLKNHKSYFFSNKVQVEISIHETKSFNSSDYFLSTTCQKCLKPLSSHFLSNATWEYSFHKFLKNFFSHSLLLARCSHSLFTHSFNFKHGQTQIQVYPKPFEDFSIIFSKTYTFNTLFFDTLLIETLSDTQISAKYVLDRILAQSKQIATNINQEMSAVNLNYDLLLNLRDKLLKIIGDIYTVMQDIFEPVCSNYSNFLDIESIRRIIFLECCRFQVDLKTIITNLKKLVSSKAMSKDLNLLKFGFDEDLLQYVYKLKNGNLTLPMCKACFVPVYEDDPGSVIAHSLSSFKYFSDILEENIDFESNLLDNKSKYWKFEVSCFEGMEVKEDCKSIYGDFHFFSVKAYFAKQFHCLRLGKKINNEEFCLSICKSVVKHEEIGKSSAMFRQTHDNRFLLKGVDKKEVKMFLSMANGYFEYMYGNLYQNKDSIINACVGVYKVYVKNLNSGKWKVQFLMVFDKIGYGLSVPHVVYDLKGTTNKRRRVKEGDKKSKMDLNFLEDFNSIPIPINKAEMEFLSKSIHNDTAFLCKCNVIDYSMLLIICLPERKIAVGLIDYMQKYTFDKVIENKYKTVVSSQIPTIVSPEMYKERFCDTILKQYFMVIDE